MGRPDPAALEALWAPIADRIPQRRRGPAFVVGVAGPQGSGKSTGAGVLAGLIEARGARTAVLSLDDLYLGRTARQALAARVHPLLATRGPPGTHDVRLGLETLGRLARPGPTRLPRFDKASDDRCDPALWPAFEGPADVILFEGWCVGARPQPTADLAAPVNAVEAEEDPRGIWRRSVNDALGGDYQALFGRIGFLVLLAAPSFEVVADWRIEQERDLRAAQGPDAGMSDEAIRRFVRFYERITRWMMAEAPARADVVVRLDERRRPRIGRI